MSGDTFEQALDKSLRSAANSDQKDWSQTVEMIVQVTERVADLQQSSRDTIDGARRVVDEARAEIEAAQQREQEARATAADAGSRLREAEELIASLRTQLAETQQRADYMEQLLVKSHYYLTRLYQTLPPAGRPDRVQRR